MTTLRRILVAAALMTLAFTVSACSGLSGGESATSDHGGAQAADAPAEPQDGAVSYEGAAGGPNGANRTVVRLRSVIKTGQVAVTDKNLDAARERLDDVLTMLDGTIDSEQTQNDNEGRIERSTIVVRVPVGSFDAAMTALQGLGTVQHADSAAKDVTTEVIDVAERVQTLERSLDRLQEFQTRAADIDDLIRFEEEITRREAELQSLKAQQAYLQDQTSMSTITLRLSTPDKYVPPPDALEDAGFLTGLKSGWNALVDTVVVVLTVVGAMLPFAVTLGLLIVPAWILVRRSLRSRAATPPAPAAASPES